jgi:hypothetical protein
MGLALTNGTMSIRSVSMAHRLLQSFRPAHLDRPYDAELGPIATAGFSGERYGCAASVCGYAGPFVVGCIRDSTNSFEMALYFLAGCSLALGAFVFVARRASDARHGRLPGIAETRWACSLARRRTFEGVIPIAKGHRYNRQAFTSAPGQNAKSSLRADVFRFAPNIGRYSAA